MLRLRSASLTDIGKVRRRNEDRFLCDDTLRLYGVADGIGGLPGGAEAAQTTVDAVRAYVRDHPSAALADAVQAANHAVLSRAAEISPHVGIGSTLSVAHFSASQLSLAHVGDSRSYVWHAGRLETLTRDHSVANEAIDRGEEHTLRWMSEANRNALTRCIGQPPPLIVDNSVRPLQAGERFLFASDGVSRVVGEDHLARFLATDAPPADVLRELLDLVLHRGAPDNATAVLVAVDEA